LCKPGTGGMENEKFYPKHVSDFTCKLLYAMNCLQKVTEHNKERKGKTKMI